PERRVEVAEAALPFLQLRLQEVDGIAGPRMALTRLGELLLEEVRRVLAPDLVDHPRVELVVELRLAAEVAGVEERGLDLQVARGEPAALADVPEGVADGEPGVPERVEDHLRDGLDVRVHLPRIEEEEVDVRARIELAAAVAALGDGDALLIQAREARQE